MEDQRDFLTLDQAAAYLGVRRSYLNRVLRQHGLGEFVRASMGRQIMIARDDLDKLRPDAEAQAKPRRSA
jgi:excisionase family DNA binding protein